METGFCKWQWCSALSLGHCRSVRTAKLHRFVGTPTACCQPVLQSSIQQWRLDSANGSGAVHCRWVTAGLYEQQSFIGVLSLPQPAVSLFSRAAMSSGDWILHREVVQCVVVGSLQTCMNSRPSHMCCHSHSLLSACFAEQH